MTALIVAVNPNSDTNGDMGAVPVFNVNATKVEETGTAVTLSAAHNGKTVYFNNASAITVTLPNSLPEGFQCNWVQEGAGQITFSAASGATKHSASGNSKSAAQYAGGYAQVKGNSNGTSADWRLFGNLTA